MKEKDLILELALFINSKLLKDNIINYKTFNLTENSIIKQLNK